MGCFPSTYKDTAGPWNGEKEKIKTSNIQPVDEKGNKDSQIRMEEVVVKNDPPKSTTPRYKNK